MSTHTVYGCYDKSTGKVTFDDTATGCTEATITGCLETSGENAGKIKITHDYGGCETQYYACYDPVTGKFEFEADDGCCEEECEECSEVGFVNHCVHLRSYPPPRYFKVILVDAEMTCSSDLVDFSGTWICECDPAVGTSDSWVATNGDKKVIFRHNAFFLDPEHLWWTVCGVYKGVTCFNITYKQSSGAQDVCRCICDDDCPRSYVNYWVACDALGNACTCWERF